MLQNPNLPYLLHDVKDEELSNPDKVSFGTDVVENVFVFMVPDGSCTARHVLVSCDPSSFPYKDGKIETKHTYMLLQVKTFFKDDMFAEYILSEYENATQNEYFETDELHTTTVVAFVASDEVLPMGVPIMLAFTPDIFDHYYLKRSFDMVDSLLEGSEPVVITVGGVNYDALFYDSRLTQEHYDKLKQLKTVHHYETRHNDEGNWVDPVSIKKEGIRVSVNFCGVIFTTEEIPFPENEIELDIDDVDWLNYDSRPSDAFTKGEGKE